MSDNLTGWCSQHRRLAVETAADDCLVSGRIKGVGVSKNTMRSASGLSRRELLQRGSLGAAGVLSLGALATLLDACSTTALAPPRKPARSARRRRTGGPGQEGQGRGRLNVLGVPPDWANYGTDHQHLPERSTASPINNAGPNDSSAQEIQAITTLKGQSRAPDVVRRRSPSFRRCWAQRRASHPVQGGDLGHHPRQHEGPGRALWYGDYYGVISFGTNTNVQEDRAAGLVRPAEPALQGPDRHRRRPALGQRRLRRRSSPRPSPTAARSTTSSPASTSSPSSRRPATTSRPTRCRPTSPRAPRRSPSSGTTSTWPTRRSFAGNPPYTVSIPATGVFGSFYCQAISKTAPAPDNAAPVAGVPLLRRGPAPLPGRLLAPGAICRPGQAQHDPGGAGRAPAAGRGVRRASSSRRRPRSTAATKVLTEQWGPKVAGLRPRDQPDHGRTQPWHCRVAGMTGLSPSATRPGRTRDPLRVSPPRAPAGPARRWPGSASCRSLPTPPSSCCSRSSC